jgi:hypothetical protein
MRSSSSSGGSARGTSGMRHSDEDEVTLQYAVA